jgi:V8-like Glu-specific endopeptidase
MSKLEISAVIKLPTLTKVVTQCFANSRNNEVFNSQQRNDFLIQGLQYREILKQLIGQEIEDSANNLVKAKEANEKLLEINERLKNTQETLQKFNQTIELLCGLADILSQMINIASVFVPFHAKVKNPVRANPNITEELTLAPQTIEPTKGYLGTATPPLFCSKNKLLINPKGDVAELIRVPRLATNIIPPYAQIPGAATNLMSSRVQISEFATNIISSATPSQPIIETVVGPDDRKRIRDTENDPWRMICSLAITGPRGNFVGTGWFAGPKTIITAAHCLYEVTQMGGWAIEISIYPGRDDNDFPYQTRSSQFEVPQEWIDSQGREADYDYGVIHLSEPLGEEIGWFSVAFANDKKLKGTRVNISGYPGDLAGNYGSYQLFHDDNIPHDGVAPNRFYYTIDTAGGQSGAPVWIELGGDQRQVVGIHTYGFGGVSGRNSATRITPKILNDIKEWIAGV